MKKKRCEVVKMSNEAKVLKKLRQKNKLSMFAVATLINKSDSYISQIENGRANPPTDNKLHELLDIYNTSLAEFEKAVINYKAPNKEIMSQLLQKLTEPQTETLIAITQQLIKN
ncbi:MAG: helix-turn-helix domain-containing protein [Bacteriovoracaceae bacterium]|nr:helix-turn-helix domain-containing protein [Bacteriovoracaceae bacterium]